MNEKIKLDLFLIDLYNVYNLESNVSYLEEKEHANMDDELYNEELEKVFKYETKDNVKTFDSVFLEKCDDLYECINTYDTNFMSELLRRLLTNNNKNKDELSNSIRFYFICTNIGIVENDISKDFNPTLFLDNEAFRKLMFGFLFSYDCFYYTHRLFLQVFKNTLDLSDVLINATVTQLCRNYCAMFS